MAKLTPKQWAKIKLRLDSGARAADLAREYGITPSAISGKFSLNKKVINSLANQLVEFQGNLKSLNINEQRRVFSLAEQMQQINENMVAGNTHRAVSFNRLSEIAAHHTKRVNKDLPEINDLQMISGLTKIGNELAVPVNAMLNSVKKEDKAEEPVTVQIMRFGEK